MAVAVIIGAVELLGLIAEKVDLHGPLWGWVSGRDLDIIGYVIVGSSILPTASDKCRLASSETGIHGMPGPGQFLESSGPGDMAPGRGQEGRQTEPSAVRRNMCRFRRTRASDRTVALSCASCWTSLAPPPVPASAVHRQRLVCSCPDTAPSPRSNA
ncbi:hypothetical protein [Streptomyces sp. NPDC088766]|uniref:hypothetical protein n=1 Tax=Streptomyces sp. NPDC088766 TaxID=3365893 RepID=UPI00382C8667